MEKSEFVVLYGGTYRMTIEQIFLRYEVPEAVREATFARAGIVEALKDVWVGPVVDWLVLTKAALFCELGTPEETNLISKKVGLDKYTQTLIARAVPERLVQVCMEHDWHQRILLYIRSREKGNPDEELKAVVEAQLMTEPHWGAITPVCRSRLRRLEIFHYKNPSV